MDRLLRPDRLEIDAESPTAAREWKHWFRTFQNFILATQATEQDKLYLLVNHVSSAVYDYISEARTFNDAVAILKCLYEKPVSEVFARHRLATRKQTSGEPITKYLENLRLLSKDCNFKAVTAETNRDDCIRDAFIAGLQDPRIRQKLLENSKLSLNDAYSQACSLELEQTQSQKYINNTPIGNTDSHMCINLTSTDNHQDPVNGLLSEEEISAFKSAKSSFCGGTRHPKNLCPDKEQVRNSTDKKGHFRQACQHKESIKKEGELEILHEEGHFYSSERCEDTSADIAHIEVKKEQEVLLALPGTNSIHQGESSDSSHQGHSHKTNSIEKPFNCLECGKSFKTSRLLRKHSRIHNGVKPFHCLECGMSFRDLSSLKTHSRIHTGYKPHHCLECGKSFSMSGSLKRHTRIHTGDKPYHCLECGKCFSDPSALRSHTRIHTGDKPYHCLDCGKSFSQSASLRYHYMTHKGHKTFRCLECGKMFNSYRYFKRHRELHSRKKHLQCYYCGDAFSKRCWLKEHINQNCRQTDPLSPAK